MLCWALSCLSCCNVCSQRQIPNNIVVMAIKWPQTQTLNVSHWRKNVKRTSVKCSVNLLYLHLKNKKGESHKINISVSTSDVSLWVQPAQFSLSRAAKLLDNHSPQGLYVLDNDQIWFGLSSCLFNNKRVW